MSSSGWNDTPLMNFLRTMCDLVILNVLCIVCCLPVVTIIASFSAMYSVIFRQQRDKYTPVIRTFLKCFKENFLQSLALEGVLIVLGVLAWGDIRFALDQESNIRTLYLIVGAIIAGVALVIFAMGIPLVAKFTNTFKNQLKNSFALAMCAPGWLLLIWIIWAIPVLLTGFLTTEAYYRFYIFILMWGVSLPAFLHAKIMQKLVFKKFGVEDPSDEDEIIEEGEEGNGEEIAATEPAYGYIPAGVLGEEDADDISDEEEVVIMPEEETEEA